MSAEITLTMAEVKQAKEDLEIAICDVLEEFTIKTGVKVDSIDVRPVEMYGSHVVNYAIYINAKL